MSRFPLGNVLDVLWSVRPGYVLLSLVILFVAHIMVAVRWHIAMLMLGYQASISKTLGAYFANIPISKVAPFFSGDFVRVYYLRDTFPVLQNAGIIFLETALDLFSLAAIMVIGSLFVGAFRWAVVGSLIFVLGMTFIILIYYSRFRLPDSWQQHFNQFFAALDVVRKFPNQLRAIIFSTFLIWVLMCLHIETVFLSLGIKIPFGQIFAFQPIIQFISILPITYSGVGAREPALAYFFSGFASPLQLVAGGLLLSFLGAAVMPLLCLPLMIRVFRRQPRL